MSDLHVGADISRYFLQKNQYFVEHYYVEGNLDVEAALISYRDFFSWVWGFDVHPTMGQTIENVVFDPIDINYAVVPVFEFHAFGLVMQNGIDHRCFHEVDRQYFYPIYFNELFLAAGSRDYHLGDMWRSLKPDGGWNFRNRVQWYAKWGYFIRELFGLIDPVMLNDIGDNVASIHEATLDLRYAAYRSPRVLVLAHGTTLLGQAEVLSEDGTEIRGYWRESVALEIIPRRSKQGGYVWIKYIRDDYPGVVVRTDPTRSDYAPGSLKPRLSKDRLLQLGVGYFF